MKREITRIEIVSKFRSINVVWKKYVEVDGVKQYIEGIERSAVSCGNFKLAEQYGLLELAVVLWNDDLVASFIQETAETKIRKDTARQKAQERKKLIEDKTIQAIQNMVAKKMEAKREEIRAEVKAELEEESQAEA